MILKHISHGKLTYINTYISEKADLIGVIMPVIQRNMLCLKQTDKLTIEERWLREAYSNILTKLVEGALSKVVIIKEGGQRKRIMEFDPVARSFHGIDRVREGYDKHFFEALLETTSYYHASKGGRGAFIERILAHKSGGSAMIGLTLKDLPTWLKLPDLVRKKKLYGEDLTENERERLRQEQSRWEWIGRINPKVNLWNRFGSKLILLEIKNRVDSGGTAAREEALSKKFKVILELLINNESLYKRRFFCFYNYWLE